MSQALTWVVFLAGSACAAILGQALVARSWPEEKRPRRTAKGDPYIDRWADGKVNSTLGKGGITAAAVGLGLCLLVGLVLVMTGNWALT